MANLSAFRRTLELTTFGMTHEAAHADKICINCKRSMLVDGEPDASLDALDWKEYGLSALCPACFDNIGEE